MTDSKDTMTAQPTVDFLVFGTGNPIRGFEMTRRNAGYIFADYLANCISMQAILLKKAAETGTNINPEQLPEVPSDFERPVFFRDLALRADIYDSTFSLTEADLAGSDENGNKLGSEAVIIKKMRVVVVKPHRIIHGDAADAVESIKRLLAVFKIEKPETQLIVCTEDSETARGCISIEHDGNNTKKHVSFDRVEQALGSDNFIRIHLGIGKEEGADEAVYYNGVFGEADREIDLFGYALDIAGQALQNYLTFTDIEKAKGEYAQKDIKGELRKLPGVVFPVALNIDTARMQVIHALQKRGVIQLVDAPPPTSSSNGTSNGTSAKKNADTSNTKPKSAGKGKSRK
eukprot:jgi/Hompol1/5070/HPOL_004152-RA